MPQEVWNNIVKATPRSFHPPKFIILITQLIYRLTTWKLWRGKGIVRVVWSPSFTRYVTRRSQQHYASHKKVRKGLFTARDAGNNVFVDISWILATNRWQTSSEALKEREAEQSKPQTTRWQAQTRGSHKAAFKYEVASDRDNLELFVVRETSSHRVSQLNLTTVQACWKLYRR